LYRFGDAYPHVAASAFIAPGARVIGDVTIGEESSIWYNAVLRGDVERISIGARSNIQDGSVVHVTGKRYGTAIGDDVLVGHMAIIHGCTLENHSFVGLGSIVMDACVIESDGMLGAGALLTPGKRIRRGELWTGRPAVCVRTLSADEIARNRLGCQGYVEVAKLHRRSLASSAAMPGTT
jgi:carbonic anhydrase/acetyltransferase-like protein (isoleucine patch superfamily)